MSDPLLLGIDIGTSAAKVGVFDRAGRPVALASAGYPITRSRPDWAEQNPDDWWQACRGALAELTATVDLADVRSVGVVSQVNTHVFVDVQGTPVRPAIVWQDQRCAEIARDLDARLGSARVSIGSSHLAARAAWVAEHERDCWDRTRWVVSPKDYLVLRLTGAIGTDPLSAIGLVRQDATAYLPSVTALADGLDRRLPRLRAPTELVERGAGEDLGLPGAAQVAVGTMDAWGCLYGSAALHPGAAFVVGGTSDIVGLVSDRRVPTPGVVTFPPAGGKHFVHAGPTQAGGQALQWWAGIRGRTVAEVLAESGRARAGAGGALFLPHLLGQRAPLWDDQVRGTFLGLSSATTHDDLARAVLEGVAFSVLELFNAVERAADRPADTIRLSGGTARSDLWCQIKADVLNRPLGRLAVHDSAVLGAALLGAVAAGLFPSIESAVDEAVHVNRVFEPDPGAAAGYAELFALYRDTYHALRAVSAGLARWRGRH